MPVPATSRTGPTLTDPDQLEQNVTPARRTMNVDSSRRLGDYVSAATPPHSQVIPTPLRRRSMRTLSGRGPPWPGKFREAGTAPRRSPRRKSRNSRQRPRPRPTTSPDFPTITVDNARQGFFERAEFDAVREALRTRGPHGPTLADVAAFGYLSGWRISEILELPWAHVDRRERLITLPSTGSSKRKKDRTLPLDYRLPNREWANGELWQLIERRWQARAVGTLLVPWVFHRRGKPVRSLVYSWRKACAVARVVGRIPHDFRRTRVRDLVNAGVPEKVAMEWTGHLTRGVFDRYHIVTAEDQRRAMALVETKAAAADNVVSITQPVRGTRGRAGNRR